MGISNEGTLMVYQVQGVKAKRLDVYVPGQKIPLPNDKVGNSWGLVPLNLERFLISYATEWARLAGFDRIGLLSGRNNLYARPKRDPTKISLPPERALKRYDEPASALGFRQRGEDNNWYKSLK